MRTSISPGETKSVIGDFLTLVYVRNEGFIFGTLQQVPNPLRDFFFIGIPVFALILIVLIFVKLRDDQIMTSVALTTILGGAVGNLVDRTEHGFVIDFIQIQVGNWFTPPPFNIADCSILLGVMIMFINTWFHAKMKD